MADEVVLNKAASIERCLGRILEEYRGQMQAMVGFRNIAVHDYQDLNFAVVRTILDKRLDDFRDFTSAMLKRA